MGLLNNLIPFALMAWAQGHIPSGLVSILNATTAFFGVIVAALAFADELDDIQAVLCIVRVKVFQPGLGPQVRVDKLNGIPIVGQPRAHQGNQMNIGHII
jgi:hypothetical protein